MIEIIPALDLLDGKCVRLTKGDFASAQVYHNNPLDLALRFQDAGLSRLHVVDLNGAQSGSSHNFAVLEELCQKTKLRIDFGGGLRSTAAIEQALAAGATAVSCGSIAITDPALWTDCLEQFGAGNLILAADFRDGQVVSHGWTLNSGWALIDFLGTQIALGIRTALCTDTSRDGLMQGPAIDDYQCLLEQLPELKLIASGGVGTLSDIERLAALGVSGVIIGKAFYEGLLTLPQLSKLQESYAH